MRTTLFLLLFFWSTPFAASNTDLVSEAEARAIAAEILLRIEPFHNEIMGLRNEETNFETNDRVAAMLDAIAEIRVPYQKAFRRDMQNGAAKFEAEENASQLSKVRMCFEVVKALARFAIKSTEPKIGDQISSGIPRYYLEFLSTRLECRHQLGVDLPDRLKSPRDVYRAYLDLMEQSLLEMSEIDDPDFLEDSKADSDKWADFRERFIWRLYAEHQWELYKLYSITSSSGPFSEQFEETIQKLWPCQTLHGSYRQLVDKYAIALVFGNETLLNQRNLSRLTAKFTECDAALTDR